MGKKARERAERRRRPVVNHARAATQLRRLNELVGRYFGQEARCIEAVALFSRAAAELGHEVRPRAVALAAQYEDSSVALGRRALGAWEGGFGVFAQVTDELTDSEWDTAGHLVATYDAGCCLFDPTLQQAAPRLGVVLGPLASKVESMSPKEGFWDFSRGEFEVRYYLAEDDMTWQEGYEPSYRACEPTARDLADIVRSGRRGLLVRE